MSSKLSTNIQRLAGYLSPRRLLALVRKVSRKNRVLLGITAGTLLSAGTLMATAPRHDPTVVEEKAWPVSTVTTEKSLLAPQLQLFGRVETPNHATLSAAIDAEVLQLHVVEGQLVRQGDLLVSLDTRDEALRLQQRAADVEQARAQVLAVKRNMQTDQEVLVHMKELHKLTRSKAERLKTLNSKNLIATEQLENTLQEVARQGIELARQQALVDNQANRLREADATVARAEALWETQQLNLTRAEVRAPFNGRVSALSAAPGNRVRPGHELVTVYDTEALQVRVPVPSAVVSDLKRALSANTRIVAQLDGGVAVATLQQLAGEIGRGKSGIDALFTLNQGNSGLELGRAVDVRIELPARQDLVALPPQSLYGNERVFLVDGERLRAVSVTAVGQRRTADGQLSVLVNAKNLPTGSQVLSTNLPKATTGLRVQVINEQLADAGQEPGGES